MQQAPSQAEPRTSRRVRPRPDPAHRAGLVRPSTRLRLVYFGFSAIWGYILGIALLAAASMMNDHPIPLDFKVARILVPGVLVALVGGIVAAGAYVEMRRRRR